MGARRPTSRRGSGWIALATLFMGLVVYRSFHLGGVRCEVCITYRGLSQCRAVDGASEEEALMAATNNVCAYLAGGVTDSLACSRTPPTRYECRQSE